MKVTTKEQIKNGEIFARKRTDDNYDILFAETGENVTRIDENVYPVSSEVSTRYEHPAGIILTLEDVKILDIDTE